MSLEGYAPIDLWLGRVRTRWQSLRAFKVVVRAALSAASVLLLALAAAPWAERSPIALAALGISALLALVAVVAWAVVPFRRGPTDLQLARFVEERVPSLDDRLVTAVDFVERTHGPAESPVAASMLADAAARVAAIDLDAVVSTDTLRRAGLRAVAAALALVIVASFGASTVRRAFDAASFVLVPSHVTLEVRPGDARIHAGAPLSIEARLLGTRAQIPAEVQIADGDLWRAVPMKRVSAGTLQLALESITTSFRYRVVAGDVTSPTYAVTIARAPRVTRIDVSYRYPAALGLPPRAEKDGGDIYAPSGTDVRISVHADRPVASGRLSLGRGNAVILQGEAPTVLSVGLKIVEDNSYRVALADADGLDSAGETEYFIRVLEDRPPEVHVTRPAGDRAVTRLQEVEIEAQADDDYGIDRLELVYSVRGGEDKAVALAVPPRATSVTARHMLYLEDLDVQPGDFVSYYVRARDRTRGARSSEARSDIFFLDVKPFEQEFSLVQSQSMAGSGYSGALDELVNAQRQVVVATWKLDRRASDAKGARSERDIRAVGRTEADLSQRAERTASSFRESTMRDPRKRAPGTGAASTAQAPPEEDAMAAAVRAMDRAVVALDALRTEAALPPEMEALNQLLRAQAEIKHRQVSLDQTAAGAAGNANRNYDISTLFDQELRQKQQTNYETSRSQDPRKESESGALDAIRELARRQDELLRRQQDSARAQMSDEDRKRQLEQLTREQSALRQRVEDLSQQMSSSPQRGQPSNDRNARLRDISEDMRQAAGDYRRGATREGGSSAGRALDKLRDLEKRMRPFGPDERRRALGDMQLEARQLADRQRQLASDLARLDKNEAGKDSMRRLAGEQDQLLERARRLEDRLKQLAVAPDRGNPDRNAQAASEAAREFERQRLSERMRQSAEVLRAASGVSDNGVRVPAASGDPRAQAAIQQDVAKELDRLAERLAGASLARDDESRRLSEQLARTQQMKENLDRVGRALEAAGRQNGRAATDTNAQKASGDRGRTGEGRQGAGGSDLSKLNEQALRQLREIKDLMDELRRNDPSLSRSGVGLTLEGQGMILSAPGTEGFKQDFAKWDALRHQLNVALEQAQSSLSKKLQAQEAKDRLAIGVDDTAPPAYQTEVDRYFKAIAAGRR